MNAVLCSDTSPSGYSSSAGDRKGYKSKVASNITASQCFAVECVSENVSIDDLMESIGKRERQFNRIGLSHGFIVPEYQFAAGGESRGAWIKHLKLAANVHYQNVSLEVAKGRKIRVRATSEVQAGEEIQLWFSPEVLIAMQIPFLTPANIKGQNSYLCTECSKVFEDPNPLKLHLARNCDSFPVDVLWTRLRNFLPPATVPSAVISPCPTPSLSPPARISAFHPVNHPPTTAFNYSDPDHLAASHLETIVSNMGTSKQGHLCIYCGKLYSRKYGLKIHIRTHTGFKPLKCKFCNRPFGDPSNLNKHVRLHLQNQTPTQHSNFNKCHFCPKIMMRKRDLQRHIEIRHFPEENQSVRGFSSDSVSNISSNYSASSSSSNEDDEDEEEPDVEQI